jgi:hypothetical protein
MAKVEQETPDDFHVRLRRGGVGLREAHGRFERALHAQLIDHVAISAVEAAVWVRSLSDLLERWDTIERQRYRIRRDGAGDGADLISGLRLAANLGLHQVVANHMWDSSALGGTSAQMSVPIWRIAWGTPSPSDRPGKRERDAYEKAVVGRDVGETLQRAARLLDVGLVPRH